MNILLIVIDTLRADHLGCYGYPRTTTPQIDALAAQGTLFEQFIAPGIPTQPSFTSLYTGVHPMTHRIVTHAGQMALSNGLPVLPELLARAGYTTCAVDNLYQMKPWFARGYEFYIDPSLRHTYPLSVTCDELNARAIPWLHAHKGEKFFLLVHYWDPHTPYLPPRQYRELFYTGNPFDPDNSSLLPLRRQFFGEMWQGWFNLFGSNLTDAEFIVALYDAEIRYVDDGVGALLAALDASGMTEQTVVIVAADHGECLGQHDIFFDHHGLYEDNIRCPLIVRWPGVVPAGRRIRTIAQHLDLAPTLLDIAGVPIPSHVEGRSLLPLMTGATDRPYYDRVITEECTWQAKWGLRTETHKFILSREPDLHGMPMRELYDLRTDPGECQNLADEQPGLAAQFEQELESWIAEWVSALGYADDPIREQGITLGKKWQEWLQQRNDER